MASSELSFIQLVVLFRYRYAFARVPIHAKELGISERVISQAVITPVIRKFILSVVNFASVYIRVDQRYDKIGIIVCFSLNIGLKTFLPGVPNIVAIKRALDNFRFLQLLISVKNTSDDFRLYFGIS